MEDSCANVLWNRKNVFCVNVILENPWWDKGINTNLCKCILTLCKLIWTTSFVQYLENQQKKRVFSLAAWFDFCFYNICSTLCLFPRWENFAPTQNPQNHKDYWGQQNINSNQTHWCMNLISDLCFLFNYRSTELMSALVDKILENFPVKAFCQFKIWYRGLWSGERLISQMSTIWRHNIFLIWSS